LASKTANGCAPVSRTPSSPFSCGQQQLLVDASRDMFAQTQPRVYVERRCR
jgi:hypothetical protein